jgi:hypothetical protein
MNDEKIRKRGQAFEGKGYGTQRRILFTKARIHIERSISEGYFCEAIAIAESIISDRLESRLSFLEDKNIGFFFFFKLTPGLLKLEKDEKLRELIRQVETWAKCRNRALHEMVKVEADEEERSWEERIAHIRNSAIDGYKLAKAIYHGVADLNPRHMDRVFPRS